MAGMSKNAIFIKKKEKIGTLHKNICSFWAKKRKKGQISGKNLKKFE